MGEIVTECSQRRAAKWIDCCVGRKRWSMELRCVKPLSQDPTYSVLKQPEPTRKVGAMLPAFLAMCHLEVVVLGDMASGLGNQVSRKVPAARRHGSCIPMLGSGTLAALLGSKEEAGCSDPS